MINFFSPFIEATSYHMFFQTGESHSLNKTQNAAGTINKSIRDMPFLRQYPYFVSYLAKLFLSDSAYRNRGTVMLDLANVQSPIETVKNFPKACYLDAEVYQQEQDTLFYNNWIAIGFEKDLPQAGQLKSVKFAWCRLPPIRNQAGTINVFSNVCRHNGMTLVNRAQQLLQTITCPVRG